MRAALYARYSDDKQNSRSIADQLAVCRQHALARNWTVVATFSDAAISGGAMANRPGLQAMLAEGAAGSFDVVLVEDEDRLARYLERQAHIYNRLKASGGRDRHPGKRPDRYLGSRAQGRDGRALPSQPKSENQPRHARQRRAGPSHWLAAVWLPLATGRRAGDRADRGGDHCTDL